ncbi:MAG: FtsX-like permease family protein, partial [Planctomycetota bacterium]
GILKALGFTDGDAVKLLALQSLLICVLGGGLGLLLARLTEPGIAGALGSMFPGYRVLPSTFALGAAAALGIGLFAGIAPAWRAARLDTVDALSAKD